MQHYAATSGIVVVIALFRKDAIKAQAGMVHSASLWRPVITMIQEMSRGDALSSVRNWGKAGDIL